MKDISEIIKKILNKEVYSNDFLNNDSVTWSDSYKITFDKPNTNIKGGKKDTNKKGKKDTNKKGKKNK